MSDQGQTTSANVSLQWEHPTGIILLSLKIFILRIITIGIYHFWGKTEVRRKIWSAVRLQNQPLQYTGSGWELFLGFVIVILLFILPIYAALIGAIIYFGENSPFAAAAQFVFFIFIMFLLGVAQYRARRYRLSRTNWRGIRGTMAGSPWKYAMQYFLTFLIVPLTLGWSVPWRDVKLHRILTNETRFGQTAMHFEGSSRSLYMPFAVLWFGVIVIYCSIGATVYALLGDELIAGAQTNAPPSPTTILLITMIIFAGLTLFAIVSAWYESRKLNYFAACTTIDQARLRLETTPLSLIGLILSNLLIILFTLGILTPVAQTRIAGYFIKRMAIDGNINFDQIAQSTATLSKTGEGLAEAFDIDAF